MKLKPIDTARRGPIQAGSVRRWRIVNRPMSIGPLSGPPIARPPAGNAIPTRSRARAGGAGQEQVGKDESPAIGRTRQIPLAAAAVHPAGDQRGDHAGHARAREHQADEHLGGVEPVEDDQGDDDRDHPARQVEQRDRQAQSAKGSVAERVADAGPRVGQEAARRRGAGVRIRRADHRDHRGPNRGR